MKNDGIEFDSIKFTGKVTKVTAGTSKQIVLEVDDSEALIAAVPFHNLTVDVMFTSRQSKMVLPEPHPGQLVIADASGVVQSVDGVGDGDAEAFAFIRPEERAKLFAEALAKAGSDFAEVWSQGVGYVMGVDQGTDPMCTLRITHPDRAEADELYPYAEAVFVGLGGQPDLILTGVAAHGGYVFTHPLSGIPEAAAAASVPFDEGEQGVEEAESPFGPDFEELEAEAESEAELELVGEEIALEDGAPSEEGPGRPRHIPTDDEIDALYKRVNAQERGIGISLKRGGVEYTMQRTSGNRYKLYIPGLTPQDARIVASVFFSPIEDVTDEGDCFYSVDASTLDKSRFTSAA